MKILAKNILAVLLVFFLFSGIFSLLESPFSQEENIPLTQLSREINEGRVKEINATENTLEILYHTGEKAVSEKEREATLGQSLLNYGVEKDKLSKVDIKFKEEGGLSVWIGPILMTLVPLLIFGVFFWSIMKQAKTGAMQTFNFTKAKARLFGAEGSSKEKITFKDVAGLKEAKQELEEIVDFLKNPKKFFKMGAKMPRGVLLIGPPGTGKTMLAKAIAGEANVPFFHTSGSTFVELFVGVGSARIRDLFATAKKHAPSIIFIDELDAIGRHRGAGIGGGHDEREQTLNQLLVEMDGFERTTQTIIISATNRPDILDPALLRPGRFDRRVILDLPDIEGREAILKIHSRNKPLAVNVNLREVAERTPGFSGADLESLANEAAILAARRNKKEVYQKEILESIEKVLLGPERKSHILSKKEKEITAFHEAGHALVSSLLPGTEKVRKISIIARGMAAGYTLQMPTEEKKIKTKSEFLSELAVLLGGYCAEKIIFNEISTGAANDLKRASVLARKLVTKFGMSELGPITFGETEELIFLGKQISEQRNYSEEVASRIDQEIAKFLIGAQKTATETLKKRRKTLNRIARVLVEKETIERQEFERIVEIK